MKKLLLLLILTLIFCLNVQAKENSTLDEKINNKCGIYINDFSENKSIDNHICASECVYGVLKKEKADTSFYTKNLAELYAIKYDQSVDNKEYFKKMYKYAILAMYDGVKDKDLALLVISSAALNNGHTPAQDLKNIEIAYEMLYEVSPKDAEKIKDTVMLAKEKKNEQINRKVDIINQVIGGGLAGLAAGEEACI